MARQRKRWFRVASKVLRKAWTNDELAGLVRLMAYLQDRWAREGIDGEEAGYAEISISDLMTVSGKRRPDVARTSAERWADIAEMSVQHRGDVTVIAWHKYPEFQGLVAPEGGRKGTSAPAPAPAPAPASKEKKKEAPATPASPADEVQIPKPGDPDRLMPLLKSLRGSESEKRAWLVAELPTIEAEVDAGTMTWAQAVRRYYQAHLRRLDDPQRGLTFDELQNRRLDVMAAKLRAEGL